MKTFSLVLAVASLLAAVTAVDVNGDPTDLNSYPPCAVCHPSNNKRTGLRANPWISKIASHKPSVPRPIAKASPTELASAVLGLLAGSWQAASYPHVMQPKQNVSLHLPQLMPILISKNPDHGFYTEIDTLAAALCAPVGGVAPVLSAVQSSILASSQVEISTTVSFAPTVTGVDQASAILATATPAPNLGNPAENVYPDCTLNCVNKTASLLTDTNDLFEICGVAYRTQTAVCEAALCSDLDRQNTQILGQQICRPFYVNNAALGSSVIAAIASATPIAQAALAGADVTDQSDWPQCAVSDQLGNPPFYLWSEHSIPRLQAMSI
ncbi:MAG: hypothetical protein Q9215_004272 [Flavoplaca cf. flavocitrina]